MSKPPKYIAVRNTLKEKMGDGGISEHLLKRSQEFLQNNAVDFTPHALGYVAELLAVKNDIQSGKAEPHAATEKILNLVMQLKANGSMFQYQLISMTSDVLLKFLEKVKNADTDFLDIIDVYARILNIILNKKLRGNGGKEGYALTNELENACDRYYVRYNIDSKK